MKLLIYSDLHLEFSHGWALPRGIDGDVLVLAGDIITFKNYEPFKELLSEWGKPVLFVTGNHEFYTQISMQKGSDDFNIWLSKNLPHVTFLQDEEISIDDVHFFGGPMWTDFSNENPMVMQIARQSMNDFQLIMRDKYQYINPSDMVKLHKSYVNKLTSWFERPLKGKRVVISHHAPVINPKTKYGASNLQPAFNSLDMIKVIEKYQPDIWIYGHTHECDDQTIGKTRLISNQLGYPDRLGGYECEGFDENGVGIVIKD
jgi:predicted phosphodiesterase